MEEDPAPRRSAATRAVAVEEDEMLCGEVASQTKNQKVFADLISRQKVLAEEMQKQQKVPMAAEGGDKLAAGHP